MPVHSHHRVRTAIVAALACTTMAFAVPAVAQAATKTVTVRVEGENATLLPETEVTIGDGTAAAQKYDSSGALPGGCKDDTASQAIELATDGDWDRGAYIQEILGETQGYTPGSWTIYDGTHYADWGACDLHLADGTRLLLQASETDSNPNYRPLSPILEWDGVPSAPVNAGTPFTLSLTKWIVPNTADTPDPLFPPNTHWLSPAMTQSDAVGYTVSDGTHSQTTNGSGNATFTIGTPGTYTFKAQLTGTRAGNWARSLPVDVCVEDPLSPTC